VKHSGAISSKSSAPETRLIFVLIPITILSLLRLLEF
jgi:hypothetical protein